MLALAARADVMMESNRAGVADRLGIGYTAVSARNRDVIYLSVTGFGQEGPYRDRAVTDTLIQAASGLMTLNLDDAGLPRRIGYAVPDYVTGMMAYQAVSTALFGRARGQGGRHLDVSLMQSVLAFEQHAVMAEWVAGGKPATAVPPTGVYRAADGLLSISVVREKYFQALCRVLGLDDMIADPRFATFAGRRDNEPELRQRLDAAFARRTMADLEAAMTADEVPHARVASLSQAAQDPHVAATGMVAWHDDAELGRVPLVNPPSVPPFGAGDRRARPPLLGEHTADVLKEVGYAKPDIDKLKQAGAIA